MKSVFICFTAFVLIECDTSPNRVVSFPWMENLVRLPFPNLDNSTDVDDALAKYPPALRPFINATAINARKHKNSTEDEVITDEDIADIQDEDEHSKVNTAHFDGKKTTITISTDAGLKLYQHWLDQAISGLMAAVATKKLESVPEYLRAAHHTCAKGATTVQAHAKCVVTLLDAEVKYQKWNERYGNAKRISRMRHNYDAKAAMMKRNRERLRYKQKQFFAQEELRRKVLKTKFQQRMYANSQTSKTMDFKKVYGPQPKEYFPNEDGWVGSFKMRAKRSVEKFAENRKRMAVKPTVKKKYNLLDGSNTSPLALLAKKLVHTVRSFKSKDKEYKSWQEVVSEIKEEGRKLKQKQKVKKMLEQRFELFNEALRDEGMNKAMIKKLDVFGDDKDDEEMETLMRKAKKQEQTLSKEDKMMQAPVKLVREGLKLGMMITGRNVSNFDKQNVKLISPRLLSLVPEGTEDDVVNLLSPSLFSLHNEGKGIEDELSLAKAFKLFDEQGHQEWLNFVIEASGVSDALSKMKVSLVLQPSLARAKTNKQDANAAAERRQLDEQFRNDEGQPLYFTKENVTEMYGPSERKKIDIFEELQKSLSKQQVPFKEILYTLVDHLDIDVLI
ncbi:unnamed protein product [Cylicocyclus nassatus]|uniref:Uncharacterized protein n=1 Tax=Cylicocyclus nassatus TaxID=53992 RepID=A0AA36HB03_CYLNA|nr:unnamed protein product [Cylicocyclus nassatus]